MLQHWSVYENDTYHTNNHVEGWHSRLKCVVGTKIVSGEDFLIAEDGQGEEKIIIFATDRNVTLLCKAETIYVDGTLETCPRLFYQVFTIHAFKNGKQFLLVYCLLPDKTRATYVNLCQDVRACE